MGRFGTYFRAEGGVHRRSKTEPIRARILSSLLLASVSISYASSEIIGHVIQSDQPASSTTPTLIGSTTPTLIGSTTPTLIGTPTNLPFWKLKKGKPSECEITDDGLCVTDGPGWYEILSRCVYVALRDMRLTSSDDFETEPSIDGEYDRLKIGGKYYFTDKNGQNNFPESLILAANDTVIWESDQYEHDYDGYRLCASPYIFPTASPTRTQSPTKTKSPTKAPTKMPFWELAEGKKFQCEITDDGLCVTDGAFGYRDNERCTYVALQDMILTSSGVFETQPSIRGENDSITIGWGTPNPKIYFTDYYGQNNFPESLFLAAGDTVKWRSDNFLANFEGYRLCASSVPNTLSPTKSPTKENNICVNDKDFKLKKKSCSRLEKSNCNDW
eukprot:CAMPEP_0194267480 /NCGR_PEP_ID=MMETSP0169-20130528/1960_1 /TAXON_ID=218684 /ORGANISM="Corethron pennatum, Strain L29A3" /LENGTH=386 /DNA_ID=CAMNT_0039008321 /DNA_START=175 /DNA_END=1332 /DNA_ORIENTATION=-